MTCRKITAGGKKLTVALVVGLLSFSTPSYADIFMGFNTDGTPIYGPEPQGATGPIATPENPAWIKNPDGTPTQAELDYTFIPNAEERAKLPPPPPPSAPPGMIQQGFNTDGTPIYAPEPQGATVLLQHQRTQHGLRILMELLLKQSLTTPLFQMQKRKRESRI